MRHSFLKEPSSFKKARLLKIPILAGSDPLPLNGQELLAGSYAATCIAPLDINHPLDSVKALVASRNITFSTAGMPRSCADIIKTIWNLRQIKKVKK